MRKHRDNYENTYEDRYNKEIHRNSYKDKDRYKKDQHRNDSYDQIRGRPNEKDYLYDDDDIFDSEIRRVHKILQMMSQEKEMAIGFMLAFSETPDKIPNKNYSISYCLPASYYPIFILFRYVTDIYI